jgi:methionyl-tRNA synthetase
MVSEVPFGSDGDFSHEKMQDIIKAKLSNDLGNLAYRTLSFAYKHCAATVPTPGPLNADD